MTAPAQRIGLATPGLRRAVVASVIGNGLEWFDFLSYAYFASTIARVFFPLDDHTASLLLTLGVFAAGFIVRPIGGVLLGLYADRAGRKRALTLLIALMAAGTLLIAVTPAYATIGLAAPALVILARLIQGLSVGGEFGSAAALLTEYAPPGRRMFYGSFQMASQGVALLLASGFGYVLTKALDAQALQDWGWRVPFLFGALIGPVGVYIRHNVGESPEFLALQAARAAAIDRAPRVPLSPSAVICGIGVIAVGTALNYLWHSYTPTYVVEQLHLPISAALGGSTLAGLIAIVAYPLSGWLADRVGAFRLFFPAVIGFALAAYPLYAYVATTPSVERLLTAQIISTLFLSLMSGPHPGMLAALFPTANRSTGIALSYNIAVTLFGGLAPVTVTWLIAVSGSAMMPAYYQIMAAVLSLILVAATRSIGGIYGADAERNPVARAG
ncbi:MAG TPA: MFS transporter [Aliidongia sp.]|uniref:MFS transporter n=1 Tax=Aliidongia sp. TaxID=1914230 RepID=UPI002DDD0D55|nr:MFS transporter [Aliidongia sp.]HEV2675501.1 MFS transporter [Aliidongia sp.]